MRCPVFYGNITMERGDLYLMRKTENTKDGNYMDQAERMRTLRNDTGMSRKEFAEYFGIPYRTLQDWELGNRTMPEYLFRLMRYKLLMENKMVDSKVP